MISAFEWQVSRSSPFPSEFKSQSQLPSLFSIVSSLSLVSTAFSLCCVCILHCVSLCVLFVLLHLLRSHIIVSSFPVFSLQFSTFSNWLCFSRISAWSCDTKALVSSPFPSRPYQCLIGILVPSPFLSATSVHLWHFSYRSQIPLHWSEGDRRIGLGLAFLTPRVCFLASTTRTTSGISSWSPLRGELKVISQNQAHSLLWHQRS